MTKKTKGDGDSAEQKRGPAPLSEVVRAKKKTSIPITSELGIPIDKNLLSTINKNAN